MLSISSPSRCASSSAESVKSGISSLPLMIVSSGGVTVSVIGTLPYHVALVPTSTEVPAAFPLIHALFAGSVVPTSHSKV